MRPTCAIVSIPRSAFGGITYVVISQSPTICGHSLHCQKKVKTITHLGHPQIINYEENVSMYEKEKP